jgi:protein-L-isoaspartate O-methyltransferase
MTPLPDGWLPDNEVRELQRLTKGKTVLELGAWKGRSTVALSQVAEYVVSVDRHRGIPGHGESLDEYLGAARELPNVAIVIADFSLFVPLLGAFDLVFIDGDHDVHSVVRDTQLALEHVTTKGTLVFHDWDFESVRVGAHSVVGPRVPNRLVGSLASFPVL